MTARFLACATAVGGWTMAEMGESRYVEKILISVYLNPQKGPPSVDIKLRSRVKERGQGQRASSLNRGIWVLLSSFRDLCVFHICMPVACYNLQNNFKYISLFLTLYHYSPAR